MGKANTFKIFITSEALRHHSFLFQPSNVFIVELQVFSKDLIGVLAESWRGCPDTRRCMGIFDGRVHELDRAASRMLDLFDHPSRLDCCTVSGSEHRPSNGNSP